MSWPLRRTVRLRLAPVYLAVPLMMAGCADLSTGGRAQDGPISTARGDSTTPERESVAEPATTSVVETTMTAPSSAVDTTAPVVVSTELIAAASVPAATVGATPYVVPIAQPELASWGDSHSSYPATDIFVSGGCGGDIVSPINGVALEVRTIDSWVHDVDNPATRGGRSVSLLGDDGVRYYLAHFDAIDPAVGDGARVTAGQRLGTVGGTGRTSACHVHFSISPPCPDKEWSIRRGVVWPYPYLDAWRVGDERSPADEVGSWLAEHPDACAKASADPYAVDA